MVFDAPVDLLAVVRARVCCVVGSFASEIRSAVRTGAAASRRPARKLKTAG